MQFIFSFRVMDMKKLMLMIRKPDVMPLSLITVLNLDSTESKTRRLTTTSEIMLVQDTTDTDLITDMEARLMASKLMITLTTEIMDDLVLSPIK